MEACHPLNLTEMDYCKLKIRFGLHPLLLPDCLNVLVVAAHSAVFRAYHQASKHSARAYSNCLIDVLPPLMVKPPVKLNTFPPGRPLRQLVFRAGLVVIRLLTNNGWRV